MRDQLAATTSNIDFVYRLRTPISLSWRRAIAVCIGTVLLGITISLYVAPTRYGIPQLRLALLIVTVGFVVHAVGHDRALRRVHEAAEQDRAELQRLEVEHATLTERVRATRDELDRAALIRNDMLATVSHELKTPLTSLLGYATILRRRADDLGAEQRAECFDIIERQGQRILRMIEDLLQSSRLSSGEPVLRREPIDLQHVVRLTGETFASMLGGRRLVVDTPDSELGLFGDATAIEHVLSNLIENAIKHSPVRSTITVRVNGAGPEVHVSVTDEGAGIAPEDLEHIFERFRQSAGTVSDRRSVGLGLYIVKTLLKAHGGRIWVDSERGDGTTFTFALPRRDPSGRM